MLPWTPHQVLFFLFVFLEHPKHGFKKKHLLGVSFPQVFVLRNAVYSLYTNNVLRRFNHGWSSLVVRRSLQLRRRRKGGHQRFRMECVLVFLLRLLPKGVRPPRPPAVFPENRIMRAFVPKARARARFCHRDASKKRCGLKKDVESSSSFLRSRLFFHSWIHPSIRKPWREEYSFSVRVFSIPSKRNIFFWREFFPFLNPKQRLSKKET